MAGGVRLSLDVVCQLAPSQDGDLLVVDPRRAWGYFELTCPGVPEAAGS